MDILKYFYEEPAAFELLTADADPDPRRTAAPIRSPAAPPEPSPYHRGYLAGTHLDSGRIGLTAVARPEAFVEPLLDWLAAPVWSHVAADGAVSTPDDAVVRSVLRDPSDTALLANADQPFGTDALRAAVGPDRRHTLPGLRALLDGGAVVLVPEPAHAGFDWSLFARRPILDDLIAAFRRHPAGDVRRFALPVRKARSEQKFYFELWQLNAGPLPEHIQEF